MASGYTQSLLSRLSGVSLPFIQRIEYGSTNPSFEIVERLLQVFGVTLSPVFSPLDWGRLAYLGVPIAADAECHHHRTIDELAREVIKCCLNASESIEVVERHRRAIEAWIWALASEYPTVFRERIDCVLVQGFLPKDPDGQHIKLRRISAGILSQYL